MAGARVNVVVPGQGTFALDEESARKILSLGGRLESEEEALQRVRGGGAQQALTAAGSALSGMSLGLSDVAFTQTGTVNPSTFAQQREANPISDVGGNITGGVTAALLTKKVPGMKYTPAGAVADLTAGVSAKVTGGVLKALGEKAGSSIIKRALATSAGHAVGGSLDGLAWGAGKAASEKIALGNPEDVGELLMTHAVGGAVFGSVLGTATGSVFGALGATAEKIAPHIERNLAKLPQGSKFKAQLAAEDLLRPPPGTDQHNAFNGVVKKWKSRGQYDDVMEYLHNPERDVLGDGRALIEAGMERPEVIRRIQQAGEIHGAAGSEYANKLDEVWAATYAPEAAVGVTGTHVDARNAKTLLAGKPQPPSPKAGEGAFVPQGKPGAQGDLPQSKRVLDDLDARIKELGGDPTGGAPTDALLAYSNRDEIKALFKARQAAEANVGGKLMFSDLMEMRKTLGQRAWKEGAPNSPGSGTIDGEKFVERAMDREFKRAAETMQDVWGEGRAVHANYLQSNDFYKHLGRLSHVVGDETVQAGFMGKALTGAAKSLAARLLFTGIGARAIGAASALGGMRAAGGLAPWYKGVGGASRAYKLAYQKGLQEMVEKSQKRMADGVKRFHGLTGARTWRPASQAIFQNVRGKNRRERAQIVADQVRRMASNPEKLREKLVTSMGPMQAAAPLAAGVYGAKQAEMVMKLAELAPRTGNRHVLQPQFDRRTELNDKQVATWERIAATYMDPLSVLDDLAGGTLTRQQAQMLEMHLPTVYASISGLLRETVAEMSEPLNAIQRQQLSIFLGEASDGTVTPGYIRRQQTMYMAQAAQDQSGGALGSPSKKTASAADSMQTTAQRLEATV